MILDDEERGAGERGYCSSLYYLFFFSSPVFCSFHLSSLASTNPTLSFPGSAGSCSRCCWWRWRRRNSGGAQGGEDGSSSSLCRDRSLCFSSPRLFSLSLCFFFVSAACFPLFSKKKKILSTLLPFPYIYRQPGERFTIPCPSARHGGVGWLLCSRCRAWPSSSFVMVAGYGGVWVVPGFLGKWRW